MYNYILLFCEDFVNKAHMKDWVRRYAFNLNLVAQSWRAVGVIKTCDKLGKHFVLKKDCDKFFIFLF